MKMKLADCRDYNIVRKSAIIDSVLWGNFKETARRHKVSPSALLCTLYGRTMAKWGNQSEVLLNLTVFQRQQKNTGKIIGDFTKLLPLNLVFAKEDIWKSAEMVQEQIMKDLDHLSFDGTEIMRELAKRRGVFGKALLPVVFTCVLFDCPENYFERLGSIKYAVSQTPQVFLDNQITEMGGRLHISWDVVDELFEACIIDEIFLEFVEDIKRISENNKANSTNDFVTKVRGYLGPIIWEGFFPEISNNENSKGYLFHPTIQTVDGEANYDCYINTVYSNSLASEIKKTERYIKRQENVASKMQQQILNIRCSQELLSKLNFSLKCKKEYHPLLLEELLDLRTESEIENIFDNFSQEYIQYSVEMRKKYWHKQYYSI